MLLPLCELANWTAYSQNTTRGFGFNPFETELMLSIKTVMDTLLFGSAEEEPNVPENVLQNLLLKVSTPSIS